ncbi:MAG: S24 family peptidase, partial [Flavobacteriales bacterium]|nr:S24 family peptidase [Flavobacteriales bacterium]
TYRVFQIQGDSMIPIPSGSYIMGTYIQNWNDIKNDQLYIIVSRSEGIVFKRVLNNIMDGVLTLKSDNPSFDTYNVKLQDVIEVWKAVGMTLLDLDFNGNFSAPQSTEELKEIQDRLSRIEGKLK